MKLWVALLPTPLLALKVTPKEPLTVGVPDRVAVPLPLFTKLTPLGSDPDSPIVGVGVPVVVTEKEPAEPTVKVLELAEVIAGAMPTTTGLFDALAAGPVPTLVTAATDTL